MKTHICRMLSTSYSLRNMLKWNNSVDSYIKQVVSKSNNLTEMISRPENLSVKEIKKYSIEVQKLKPVVDLYTDLVDLEVEIDEMECLCHDGDPVFKSQVKEEIFECGKRINELQMKLIHAVLPRDEDDISNAILEIRAGVGGQEASLFASEIMNMYIRLARNQKWKFEITSQLGNSDALGKATASITGSNVFGMLKFESGVHRIQRVPVTDTQGRIHTSTIAVSVLPQPRSTDFVLNMKDVKIDTYKSTGPGGQHVNTTDSAVRMTHLPSGVVVTASDRSQIKNRETCIRLLSAQVYDLERTRRIKEHNDAKRLHLNNLDRSQRIRTYNFPQDRVTDHRINISFSSVQSFLHAGDNFWELNDSLAMHEKINSLSILESNMT